MLPVTEISSSSSCILSNSFNSFSVTEKKEHTSPTAMLLEVWSRGGYIRIHNRISVYTVICETNGTPLLSLPGLPYTPARCLQCTHSMLAKMSNLQILKMFCFQLNSTCPPTHLIRVPKEGLALQLHVHVLISSYG